MSASNTNHTRITQGFQFLLQVLSPYIARELRGVFGSVWWNTGVLDRLYDEQKRNLPRNGDDETLTASLDIYLCLLLLDLHWNEIFRKKLPMDCRTWAKELVGVRNRWAHMGNEDFNDDDTWRALIPCPACVSSWTPKLRKRFGRCCALPDMDHRLVPCILSRLVRLHSRLRVATAMPEC